MILLVSKEEFVQLKEIEKSCTNENGLNESKYMQKLVKMLPKKNIMIQNVPCDSCPNRTDFENVVGCSGDKYMRAVNTQWLYITLDCKKQSLDDKIEKYETTKYVDLASVKKMLDNKLECLVKTLSPDDKKEYYKWVSDRKSSLINNKSHLYIQMVQNEIEDMHDTIDKVKLAENIIKSVPKLEKKISKLEEDLKEKMEHKC